MNRRIRLVMLIAPVIMLGCSRCSSLTGLSGADTVHNDSPDEIVKANETPKEISLIDLMSVGGASGSAKVSTRSAREGDSHKQDITGLERVYLRGGNGKVLTQEMIGTKLRRYVIEGTFDLGGKKLVMPYGSVLDLEEGELRNGSIVMDQTRVTPVYGISRQTRIKNVKVSGDYFETLVDLWGVSDQPLFPWDSTPPRRVYTVDIKKFGITPGYQKRRSDGHYSDSQYDLMYRNGVGFTKAIQWASQNGYDGIRFPKNDYCFTPRTVGEKNSPECGQVLVQDLVKFDIDLGGGSYYNILDSSVKSKYYKAEGASFEQRCYMFWLSCCVNVQIHNGMLVGDRALRDYADPKERNQEHTYGIVVSGYCHNIRLHHLDLSGFMGDGIIMHQAGDFFKDYNAPYSSVGVKYVGEAYPGRFVDVGGRIVNDSRNDQKCTVSDYIDYSGWYPDNMDVPRKLREMKVFSVNNNRGYTRIPNIYLNVDVLTFNKNISTERPLRIIPSSYLERFQLMDNETGVRFQFYHEDGVGSRGVKHNMSISDVINSDCVIEYCHIHDNHRGGVSGGCNRTIIRHNKFEKNDRAKNRGNKTIPLFQVGGTNYHIDYEDSYGKDLEICHNTFDRNGNKSIGKILLGVLTFSFHDNVTDCGPATYNNLAGIIYDNRISSTGFEFASWILSSNDSEKRDFGCQYLTRTTLFKDNSVKSVSNQDGGHRTISIIDNSRTLR